MNKELTERKNERSKRAIILKMWRSHKKLTQSQAADRFGVSPHTLAKWESGERMMPDTAMKKIKI